MRFAGRVVVVTGAARGIGRAVVERLAAEGAQVHGIDVRAPDEAGAPGAAWHRVDVADPGAIAAFFARLDRCDGLVNNAAIPGEGALGSLDLAGWRRVFDVNVAGSMLMAQAAVPLMAQGGAIVNVASVAAQVGFAERAAYCSSKAAILGLTRALAVELAPRVRVNCLCPGTVDTPWIERLVGEGADRGERWRAMEHRQVLGRLGSPDEIAAAAAFLLADDAAFLTGSILMADGGMTARAV